MLDNQFQILDYINALWTWEFMGQSLNLSKQLKSSASWYQKQLKNKHKSNVMLTLNKQLFLPNWTIRTNKLKVTILPKACNKNITIVQMLKCVFVLVMLICLPNHDVIPEWMSSDGGWKECEWVVVVVGQYSGARK